MYPRFIFICVWVCVCLHLPRHAVLPINVISTWGEAVKLINTKCAHWIVFYCVTKTAFQHEAVSVHVNSWAHKRCDVSFLWAHMCSSGYCVKTELNRVWDSSCICRQETQLFTWETTVKCSPHTYILYTHIVSIHTCIRTGKAHNLTHILLVWFTSIPKKKGWEWKTSNILLTVTYCTVQVQMWAIWTFESSKNT